MTLDKFITPQEVRVEMLTKVSHFLNQAVQRRCINTDETTSLKTIDMLPYVDCAAEVDLSGLHFECEYGGLSYKYIINLNLGEVRIGILIPNHAELGSPIQLMENLTAYDYKSPFSPTKVVNLLNEGLLLEHVFNSRFAESEIMFRALCADYPDDRAIAVLADAIASELILINHSLMDVLTEKGYIPLNIGLFNPKLFQVVQLDTTAPKAEILERLSLNKSQLFKLSADSYLVALLPNDSDAEANLKVLQAKR
jgi:hypothetical protein